MLPFCAPDCASIDVGIFNQVPRILDAGFELLANDGDILALPHLAHKRRADDRQILCAQVLAQLEAFVKSKAVGLHTAPGISFS